MKHSSIKTIEWQLANWGRWAYVNRGVRLYYPSATPFERMRRKFTDDADISDAEAFQVDRAVSSLRNTYPELHDLLVLHYLAGQSYRAIARRKKRHHREVSEQIVAGRMWVESAIQHENTTRNGAPLV